MQYVLLISVFVVATCGLIYELIAGTLASYLLGDSVTQFSTVIGTYLSAMGVGSYLSRYCKERLLETFIKVEVLLALIGGSSAALLFLVFDVADSFRLALYGMVFLIGVLVGLEIPLLMRILKTRLEFSDLVSRVLSFDYLGALVASILFPLVLAPQLGLVRTAFLFGLLNNAVALWVLVTLGQEIERRRALFVSTWAVFAALLVGFIASDELVALAEAGAYAEPVIFSKSTPYQRIVLTKSKDDLRLYLNGALQFSSRDEYRYHESLVHPGLSAITSPRRVLILGGGDGLAAREALRYAGVERIVLIDLDREVTALFRASAMLTQLNGAALASSRVEVINEDAFEWVRHHPHERFDFVIIDLPDPSNYSVGKLYTTAFYRNLQKLLVPGARGVVQTTSPLLARRSFWCVEATLRAVGLKTLPYHSYVPSFGEWGFVLFSADDLRFGERYPSGLRYVSAETVAQMTTFPGDMSPVKVEVNRLDNQILVSYYDDEWSRYTN